MLIRALFGAGKIAACILTPLASGAQTPAQDVHTVAGRVLRPGGDGLTPVSGQWVVLHRLGSDRAGPLDSMRTDQRGGYRFRYVPSGDERALYFAAAVYGGVAYFTPPLDHDVAGEAAEIVVYDTTTRDIRIAIRGRHLVVSAADPNAQRSVMEVYELSNDTRFTRVSPTASSPPTWRTQLPPGARDPRISGGDVPAEAAVFERGEIRLVTPLPPGIKQLAYTYSLPASNFPLSIPVLDTTDLLEVLVEEPDGRATGARLGEVEPVTVEGRHFRRFLAQDVPQGSVTVVDIPRAAGGSERRAIFAVVLLMGGIMLVVLARAVRPA